LLLEDGTTFVGRSFGAEGEQVGEVVFNTSMTGYQEILTDPSYRGQMVVMTYPLIGNYGVHSEESESERLWLSGLIVKEYVDVPAQGMMAPLAPFLIQHGIVAMSGIDTRALTRRIRRAGAMPAILSTQRFETQELLETLAASPTLIGRDLVREVTSQEPQTWSVGTEDAPHVVVYNFGVKHNILRRLAGHGCRLTVVPADTPASAVLALRPHGVLLSNGPGDPEALTYAIRTVERLLDKVPIFGICLGHQILGIALGGRCMKLKFGHHGGNHPVRECATGHVLITAQNHNFSIDCACIEKNVEITYTSLNDQTVEGLRHRTLPVSSVQFHPEAAPGPHDAHHLFDGFLNDMKRVGPC